MNVGTEGVKRPAPNTKTAMIKRAREGEVLSDFKTILDEQKITENIDKQQMLMQGLDFKEDSKKSRTKNYSKKC